MRQSASFFPISTRFRLTRTQTPHRRHTRNDDYDANDNNATTFRTIVFVKSVASINFESQSNDPEGGLQCWESGWFLFSLTTDGLEKRFWALLKFTQNSKQVSEVLSSFASSVTRMGDLLDFGQLFKAFGNN